MHPTLLIRDISLIGELLSKILRKSRHLFDESNGLDAEDMELTKKRKVCKTKESVIKIHEYILP